MVIPYSLNFWPVKDYSKAFSYWAPLENYPIKTVGIIKIQREMRWVIYRQKKISQHLQTWVLQKKSHLQMQIFFLFLKINLLDCYRNRFFTKNSSVFSKKKNGFMRKPRIYGPTAQTCLMWVFMNGAVSRDFIPSSNNGDCLPGTLFEARLFQKKIGNSVSLNRA